MSSVKHPPEPPRRLSAEDYARAEQFLPWNVNPRVRNLEVRPHWIEAGDRFWYERQTRDGAEVMVIDVRTGERRLVDDEGERESLRKAAGTGMAGERLDSTLTHGLISPDGRWAVSARDSNLILRDMDSGDERALTEDGEPHHAYGKSPDSNTFAVSARIAGIPMPPMALWSPDSRRLLTVRLDERSVKDLHLLQLAPPDASARPVLHTYRYAMAADEHIPHADLWVFDIPSGRQVRAEWTPIPAPLFSPIELQHVWWSEDGTLAYFIDLARGCRECRLCELDPATGAVRPILEEQNDTYLELNLTTMAEPNVRILGGGEEVIWFSERDGWGHLYLYDGRTGELKNQITAGDWLVRDIIRVDEKMRRVYFTACGREPERDPYYRHLYGIDLDGSGLALLTPEDADHQVSIPPASEIVALAQMALLGGSPSVAGFSPSGRYFVDTWSRMDAAPPFRSKAFHDFAHGRMEDAGGLEDHIAGLRQLADRHPYMDLDRVGITGHSGGGFASTRAILAYPEFYKVAKALIEANKDFDLVLLPNRNHPTSLLDPYMLRRLWDHFVEHLLGAEPPASYRIHGPEEPAVR